MKIVFSCLGFQCADVFLMVGGRQLMMGVISDCFCNGKYSFWPSDYFMEQYVKRDKYVKWEDIPRNDEIITEYINQLSSNGVSISKKIVYA